MSLGAIPPALIGAVDDWLTQQKGKLGAGQPPPQPAQPAVAPKMGAPALVAPDTAAQPPAKMGGGILGGAQPQPAPVQPAWEAAEARPPAQAGTPQIGAPSVPDYAARYEQWAAAEPKPLDPNAGKPSTLRKIGGIATGALLGAFSPEAGGKIGASIVNGPRNELQRQHDAAEGQWQQQGKEISTEAGLADTTSQIHEREAVARKSDFDVASADKPKPKEEEWNIVPGVKGPNGEPVQQEKNSGQVRVAPLAGASLVNETGKNPPGAKEQLQQQLSAEMAKSQPDQKTIKSLQDRLKAIDPLAEDRLKDAENRAATAATTGANKTDMATREKVLTYYKPAQDADVRLQLMEKNEKDALRGNQQAMVNLLANHIALTMGLPRGKVPRVSYQMFQEAQQSAPILQRAEAHFDKEGYLTGVVLSPDQMKAMVALAHETRDAEWQSSDSSADYIGIAPNDRPKSIYGGASNAPAGASDEVYAKDGTTLIGHVVNGAYVPLQKQ
jgi:hypothetical protein